MADSEQLATLMLAAYRGTIDYDGKVQDDVRANQPSARLFAGLGVHPEKQPARSQ